MDQHLETLVELQKAQSELIASRIKYEGVPEPMQAMHEEHARRREEIEELEATIAQAEKEQREAENEIALAQEQIERFQAQISQVTTQREYGALLSETDTVREQIQQLEDTSLASLEKRDEAQARLDEAQQEFAEIDKQYREGMKGWEAERPDVKKRIELLEGQIEVYQERLPKPILLHYRRLYERQGGSPLAAIVLKETAGAGIRHCGFCNHRIRPQTIVEIQTSSSLTTCDSCQRILYLEDDGS